MGDLASLLPGIAAVITSLGGIGVSIYAINRGSKRERHRAAEKAIDRMLGDDDEDEDDERREAIEAFVEELLKRQGKDGDPS